MVVIRYEGPKGSPGMPEMLAVTAAIAGAGLGKEVALITDGRFSGATKGFSVDTSRRRRSSVGRSRSSRRETGSGSTPTRDRSSLVDDATLESRRGAWTAPAPRYTTGALAKYAKLVGSADHGAITG